MVAHCWLDEEARLEVKRDQGILNNIYDPLQCHNWPEDIVSQSAGESLSSGGSLGGMSMKSLAVTRLSEVRQCLSLRFRTGVCLFLYAGILVQCVLIDAERCILDSSGVLLYFITPPA